MSYIGFGAGPGSGLRFSQTRGRIQGNNVNGVNYPSPFFDVAHTYLPTTVKQLFRWCRYYFLTNPLINATVFKLSEYPITDVIIDHESLEVKKRWTEYMHDQLRIRPLQVEIGLDYHGYGNAMMSIGYPFKKYLYCKSCDFRDEAAKIRAYWTFTNYAFRLTCPRCQQIGDALPQDFYIKNPSGIKIIRWNVEDIEITYNDITGDYTYYYTIPPTVRNDVVIGRKDIVEAVPQVFIQAMREQKGIVFNKDNFFHMRRPTLATQDRGWGIPLLLPVLKDTFYLQLMKKAQECVAPDTLLETTKGLVRAGDMAVGDQVKTHLGRYRAVTQKAVRPMVAERGDYAVRITLEGVTSTPGVFSNNHPLWVLRDAACGQFDWVDAGDVKTGCVVGYPEEDCATTGKYVQARVTDVTVVDCASVVSLEVAEDHTFCVPGMATHNSILLEHIVPLRILFPQAGSGSSDVYTTVNLIDWREQVASEIARWRMDSAYIPILPLPVGQQTIGGDGRALLLTSEIQQWSEQIISGMGVPMELLKGGLCLAQDSLIFTSNGLEELSEITPAEPGTQVIERVVQSHVGRKLASQGHNVGMKKASRLLTRLGMELIGAATHPVLTLRPDLSQEFVPIHDLKPGDFVAVKSGTDIWAPAPYVFDIHLEKVGGRYARADLPDIRIPKRLTPELARIMGYLISEGTCTDPRRMSFSNKDIELINDFIRCVESVFGYEPTPMGTPTEDGNVQYVVEISRQTAVEFLRKAGLIGYSAEKRVPISVRKSPKRLVVEFLRAYLDGDGGVENKKEKQSVFAVSTSRRLLQEVQLMLLNMGIVSSLYPTYESRDVHTLQIRSTHVDRFASEVGFISSAKRTVLAQRTATRTAGTISDKLPYVREALVAARDAGTKGCSSWRFEPIDVELTKSVYSVADVAALVDRDVTTIYLHVRSGALKATKVAQVGGEPTRYEIQKDDLDHFFRTHGLGKRRAVAVDAWGLSYTKLSKINMESVRALKPELYERINKLTEQGFIWDEVKSVEDLEIELPMRDLGVQDAHSYQANGILCHNSFSGTNVSLRMLENTFIGYILRHKQFARWVMQQVSAFLDWPEASIRFKPFKMADDLQRRALDLQLKQVGVLSDTTLMSGMDYSVEDENALILREADGRIQAQKKSQLALAEIQGESQLIMMKYQVKGQQVMAQAQQAPAAPGEPGGPEAAGGTAGGQEAVQSGASAPVASLPQQAETTMPSAASNGSTAFLQSIGSQLSGSARMNNSTLNVDLPSFAMAQAQQIAALPKAQQETALKNLDLQSPELGALVRQMLASLAEGSANSNGAAPQVDTRPTPDQRAPRRAGTSI